MLTYGHSCRPFTDNLLEDPVVTRKIKEIFGDETKMEEVRIEKIDGKKISKKQSNRILQKRVADEIKISNDKADALAQTYDLGDKLQN